MNWPLLVYGLGFGITWVVLTRWYVKDFDPSEELERIAIGGLFGMLGAVLWPLVVLGSLMGLAAKRTTS